MAGDTINWVLAVTTTLLLAAACQSHAEADRSGAPATPPALSLAADSQAAADTTAAAGRCRSAQLELSFVAGQGAAGTIFLTFRLRNTGSAGCQLRGFVRLQMLDEAGRPLPTRVIPNGGAFSNQPPPSRFTLPPRSEVGLETASTFQLAYSTVQRGQEESCTQAYELLVTPPDELEALTIPVQGWTLAPCNGGQLNVTPLRAPGVAPA